MLEPPHEVQPRAGRQRWRHLGRARGDDHAAPTRPATSSTAASHSAIRLGHVLVGREQDRAQDQRPARRPGYRGLADTGCMRTTTRSATSGSAAAIRSAIAVHGATSTSDRRAARRTIHVCRDTASAARGPGGHLGLGEEVQRVGEQRPPLAARRRNPTLFSATRRPRRTAAASLTASHAGLRLPPRPITLMSSRADVFRYPCTLGPVPGGPANLAACDIDGYRRRHWFPPEVNRQPSAGPGLVKTSRRSGARAAAPADAGTGRKSGPPGRRVPPAGPPPLVG